MAWINEGWVIVRQVTSEEIERSPFSVVPLQRRRRGERRRDACEFIGVAIAVVAIYAFLIFCLL